LSASASASSSSAASAALSGEDMAAEEQQRNGKNTVRQRLWGSSLRFFVDGEDQGVPMGIYTKQPFSSPPPPSETAFRPYDPGAE
jgi:hypothetical protein